jgi:hypothetical protein
MAKKQEEPAAALEHAGDALYFVYDGVRIAKRGDPGSAHAGTWVSIEPGYEVIQKGDEIGVWKNGIQIH